jgi:PASTA domain
MRPNILALIGGIAIAKSKGAPNRKVFSDALLASMVGPPVMGIALAGAIAQNQASSASGPVRNPGNATPAGAVPVLSIGAAYERLRNFGIMPSFHGMRRNQAEQFATLLGLDVQVEGSGDGVVVWQEPGIGKRLNPNNLLKLKLED